MQRRPVGVLQRARMFDALKAARDAADVHKIAVIRRNGIDISPAAMPGDFRQSALGACILSRKYSRLDPEIQGVTRICWLSNFLFVLATQGIHCLKKFFQRLHWHRDTLPTPVDRYGRQGRSIAPGGSNDIAACVSLGACELRLTASLALHRCSRPLRLPLPA
jgi:hypothetical protein